MESPIKALKEFRLTKNYIKRALIMIGGIVLMGITVALFNRLGGGSDPFSATCFAISNKSGISFGTVEVIVNVTAFLILALIDWKVFGLGTVVNMICVGYIADFTTFVIDSAGLLQGEISLVETIGLTAVSLVVFLFGVGLYIDTNLGTSPYDAIPGLILKIVNKKREKKLPYRVVRIPYDLVFTFVAFAISGKFGILTLLMALFLGPVCDAVAVLLKKFINFD